MPRMNRSLSAIICCVSVALFGASAYSSNGELLDCDRFGGEEEFQVYINEAQGYILYNAELRDSYEREREYSVVGGEEGETIVVDEGLDIQVSTDRHIQAGDETSSFVFAKETATYAHAWTMFVPNRDGKLVAFGMHHSGRCSMNPFAQPN